jgi:hypothetical protein
LRPCYSKLPALYPRNSTSTLGGATHILQLTPLAPAK